MENLQDIFRAVGELLSNKALQEKDLLTKPMEIGAEKSYPIQADEVTFSIGASAKGTIQLFNDENDTDTLKLIGARGFSPVTTPILFNPATEAYLKYGMEVSAKANANVNLGSLGIKLDGSGSLQTGWYSLHSNADKINQAFPADISHFVTIFKYQDLSRLTENSVVYLTADGALQCNLKMSWSNIFTQSLSALTASLPVPVTLDLNISPELTADFSIEISDSFQYVVKRLPGNRCLIRVNKSSSNKKAGSLGASVGLSFANQATLEQQLNQLLGSVLKSIFGYSISDIDSLITKIKTKVANSNEAEVFRQVARILGFPDYVDEIVDAIDKRWQDIKKEISAGIEKAAKLNVGLAVQYEYERIEEGSEMLSLEMDLASLQPYHTDLLRLNLNTILNDLRRAGGIVGVTSPSYLGQQSLTINRTFGLGLKIWDFQILSSKDFESQHITSRTDLQNHKQLSVSESRGYKWSLGRGNGSWSGEFSASMPAYSSSTNPTVNEFQFQAFLSTMNHYNSLNEDEFRTWLDRGVIWSCLLPAKIESLVAQYFPILHGQPATFDLALRVSPFATQTILNQIFANGGGQAISNLMSKSMASALPYLKEFWVRKNAIDRETAYAPLWARYLHGEYENTPAIAYDVYETLRKLPKLDALPEWERRAGMSTAGIMMADLIFTNPGIRSAYQMFIKGALGLQNAVNNHLPSGDASGSNLVAGYFRQMSALLTQSFYVESLGSFFCHFAAANPILQKEITGTLTITYQVAGKDQHIIITII